MDSRIAVADVDGADRWGSAKIRETFVRAGDYFEGACQVGIEFLFMGQVVSRFQVVPYLTGHLSSLSNAFVYVASLG